MGFLARPPRRLDATHSRAYCEFVVNLWQLLRHLQSNGRFLCYSEWVSRSTHTRLESMAGMGRQWRFCNERSQHTGGSCSTCGTQMVRCSTTNAWKMVLAIPFRGCGGSHYTYVATIRVFGTKETWKSGIYRIEGIIKTKLGMNDDEGGWMDGYDALDFKNK